LIHVSAAQASDGASPPQRHPITQGWQVCAVPPGSLTDPARLDHTPLDWIAADTLGPAADVLRQRGLWSLDGPPRAFDADDWWYRTVFTLPDLPGTGGVWLGFDGLATVADVWLNGQHVLHATNQFRAHELELRPLLKAGPNQLVLRFHALDTLLAARRPRPRWRTPMVAQQQLRWFRTTLLGRTPGWSPPVAAVGPVKDIWWEFRAPTALPPVQVDACLAADGVGRVSCTVPAGVADAIEQIELQVSRDGVVQRALLARDAQGAFHGSVSVPDAAAWWPHTHGEPALYELRLQAHWRGGASPQVTPLRRVGFRRLSLDTRDGGFVLQVNGEPVFCRGACWTPLDVVRLRASPEALREAVAQVRDAGMNMLRVGGTMVYEDDAFFDACDELGVLVWQEFMFANMDYPADDPAFLADVQAEAVQQLQRWRGRPSLAVLCGNSEVEQQAAMWGAARALWSPALFHEHLRGWSQAALPGVPYWPSSAHGGAFPHQADQGSTSYYGVGAYLRPPEDARRAGLRFATECLAFANVPDASAIARMPGGAGLRVHHPGWKARTPRDLSAGWDFEDVRDHYFASTCRVDPVSCRSTDHERYLALSRVLTGELMAAAFSEWRRPGASTGGALVWFLRDLWAGAGWGLLDERGGPKACWRILRRALQPVAAAITDEGVNGLYAQLVNDRPAALSAQLELTLFGRGDVQVGQSRRAVELPARGGLRLPLVAELDGFSDLSYAYRFGPPSVTLVQLRLLDAAGALLSEAFHLPAGWPAAPHAHVGLKARFDAARGELVVSSTGFAQHVHLELAGHEPSDNDFHLAPGAERRIAVRRTGSQAPRGEAWALNADHPVAIVVSA
jgi:beta-mannosidase